MFRERDVTAARAAGSPGCLSCSFQGSETVSAGWRTLIDDPLRAQVTGKFEGIQTEPVHPPGELSAILSATVDHLTAYK